MALFTAHTHTNDTLKWTTACPAEINLGDKNM